MPSFILDSSAGKGIIMSSGSSFYLFNVYFNRYGGPLGFVMASWATFYRKNSCALILLKIKDWAFTFWVKIFTKPCGHPAGAKVWLQSSKLERV
jgi:hypothetical protein